MYDPDITRGNIFKIIRNQMKLNDPPEVNYAYKRLKDSGINEMEVMKHIGQCFAIELFDVLKNQNEFNKDRYIENLKNLPKEPEGN